MLIGRYLCCRSEDELHWVQRWVEVHPTAIITCLKEGEAPTRRFELDYVEVIDEGDRHFSLACDADHLAAEVLESRLVHTEGHDDYEGHTDGADNEPDSTAFRTVTNVDELVDEYSSAGSDGEVTPAHQYGNDRRVVRMLFRCCDRIECLEMLQSIGHALWQRRFHDAAVQVTATDFAFVEVPLNVWLEHEAARQSLQAENASLAAQIQQLSREYEALLDSSQTLRTDCTTATQALQREHELLMESMKKSWAQECEDAKAFQKAHHDVVILRLQDDINDLQLKLRTMAAAMQRDQEAYKKRIKDLIDVCESKRHTQDLSQHLATHIRQLLLMRCDHGSWLRHHLCAQQIARFALSLKRAGTILTSIPGASQFAKEFQSDWPIVGKLIELPTMMLEEDAVLQRIAKLCRTELHDQMDAKVTAKNFSPEGKGKSYSTSQPRCYSPALTDHPACHEYSCLANSAEAKSRASSTPGGGGEPSPVKPEGNRLTTFHSPTLLNNGSRVTPDRMKLRVSVAQSSTCG